MRAFRVGLLALLISSMMSVSGRALAAPSGSSADSMNFRFAPVWLLVGLVEVNMDFAVNDNWTFGPELNLWKFNLTSSSTDYSSDYAITAFGLGARANWFMEGVFTDGMYVGPFAKYVNVKVETKDLAGDDVSGTASGFNIGCLVGYGWFWDSFNMMLGGGIAMPLSTSDVEITDSTGTSTQKVKTSRVGNLALEFSLGWTF